MTTESEQALENALLKQLEGMKYERVKIRGEEDLLANLKVQLEKHNKVELTDKEFERVLIHLSKGNVYDRAKTLRDKMHLPREGSDDVYLEFFNSREWCQNEFQVTNQVTMTGSYKNRYDVTILINGLPLVQVELKRRGMELKEAFNQTNRYHRHSYSSSYGLFQYIQVFVISNGVNTKYYANNRNQSFQFTSFWADKDNKRFTELSDFTKEFLDRCQLAKIISRYVVLAENKTLMVLRPYQYYAAEAIIDRVKNSKKGGYIWHTTGSGKTLTSFKASQVLVDQPDIYKVVFVVDRNDLDTQTIREFNKFQEGSVDTTDNTRKLVRQFGDPDSRLIVTTIQKLNNAITHQRHAPQMAKHRDQRIVFIFDECHRSQFGETHKRITEYFTNHQLFGFTGTPIFKDNASGNALGRRTTFDLFGDRLHQYVITDAIKDENVLKFSVEYVGKYKYKDSAKELDIEVEDIDRRELMESEQRLEKIVDYILVNHDRKTYSRNFTSIFAVSSIDTLSKYYEIFKSKQAGDERPLRVATIFSYAANEDDKDATGLLQEDVQLDEVSKINKHSRDKLESYIADYNTMFGTNYTTKDSQSFYNYYRDIADRVRKREVDVLLVVNMFLTGFDSKPLNTLYVDKNLRYHGLLQAYSRTNRILNETKAQGNIVSFRNLKSRTDDALRLFADKNAQEVIFVEPYENYLTRFSETLRILKIHTPTVSSVDELPDEIAELNFVTHFRELLRHKNVLVSFTDFKFEDLNINEQEFENYKSKYLDVYEKVRREHEKEKVSILEDVDFELELVKRDDINVSYIIRLLARLVNASDEQRESLTKNITDALSSNVELRSKRELIEKFIKQNIPDIEDADQVETEFDNFWNQERLEAFKKICEEEGLDGEQLQQLIDTYLYSGRKPKSDDIVGALKAQPRILDRPSIVSRVSKRFSDFIQTFIEGV